MGHTNPQPRSGRVIAAHIRTALIGPVVIIILTTAALHVVLMHRYAGAVHRQRMQELATLSAAALRDPPATMRAASATHAIDQLLRNEPAVCERARIVSQALLAGGTASSVIVTDGSGLVAFRWPPSDTAPAQLTLPRGASPKRLAAGDDAPVAMLLACAPLSGNPAAPYAGYACVLGADADTSRQLAHTAGFAAATALICAAAMLLALRRLHRQVVVPLGRISSLGPGEHRALTVDSNDEFGAIAKRLDELSNELHDARADAQRLRNSFEHAVSRETRQISQQLRRAERAAEIDTLTGLANRRFIDERLEAVFSEQISRGVNLAVIMLDVDNFKPLNDQAGHAAGDALLRFVGDLLRGTLREGDVGVRYGGDEFALLLVDVTGAQARSIADRVIRLFARQTTAANLPVSVTLSAGVASLDEVKVRSGAELLTRADDVLYRAKRSGKNLVHAARG